MSGAARRVLNKLMDISLVSEGNLLVFGYEGKFIAFEKAEEEMEDILNLAAYAVYSAVHPIPRDLRSPARYFWELERQALVSSFREILP